MSEDAVLEVRDLRYRYPGRTDPALDSVTFRVGRCEIFGFLGPSGAGKTTTQRAILGLVEGWTGSIAVLGRERGKWGSELFDSIGVAFELPVGYPRLTGREDLDHFSNLHGRTCRDSGEVLEAVGLTEVAGEPVGSYSKGMRARLNLARAILHSPQLLFLDEPTAGLDPVNAASIRELILAERDRGCSVFLTTHDMVAADAVCDRVAFIVDGRIAACDSPRALHLQFGEPYIRVEHRTEAGLVTTIFPLGTASAELTDLLASGRVETVHTSEAGLDRVFTEITGRRL
ncbi:MAG: ABC transporter ATP-binding protein [Actinobacteria bacterium]|nr:ABC transporter ATP-binding protein [Actinomycetota bacterium]